MDELNYVEKNEKNYWSIAGFALVFLYPIMGIIFSIIGLDKSKSLNGRGQLLSIVGVAIGAFMIVFNLIIDILFELLYDLVFFFI